MAFRPGMYALPPECVANGLTGAGLEVKLAREVDERIPGLVSRCSGAWGKLEDERLRQEIVRFVRVLSNRHPATLRRTENSLAEVVRENRALIQRLAGRARTPEKRAELAQYLDDRLPRLQARAMLAALVADDAPVPLEWLNGDVHLISFPDVASSFQQVGLSEFVTFDPPVVEWEGATAPVATVALSRFLLAAITKPGSPDGIDHQDVAIRHMMCPVRSRREVYCSEELSASALYRAFLAAKLPPWSA